MIPFNKPYFSGRELKFGGSLSFNNHELQW